MELFGNYFSSFMHKKENEKTKAPYLNVCVFLLRLQANVDGEYNISIEWTLECLKKVELVFHQGRARRF